MAEIFPENIDDFVNATDGERRVFELLKSEVLPKEEFIAWYEPKIHGRGQIVLKPDFVIWGKSFGLVILEVKDWGIDSIKEWNDTQVKFRNGQTYKNPERQAIDYVNAAMNNLKKRNELVNQAGTHRNNLKFPCTYGVVLTNITSAEFQKNFGKVINSHKILFSDDLLKIENGNGNVLTTFLGKISSLFQFNPLTQTQIDILRSILFPRVIINPRKSNQPIKILDKEQEQEAWKIGPGHRIIKGVAGSGKTILVAYRAKILKALHPDYKILIICYNITLKRFLRAKIMEIIPEAPIDDSQIDIFHFHDFAYDVIRNMIPNGNNVIRNIGSQSDWNTYQSKLGDILMNGIDDGHINEGMYDAILVDECQDLTTDFLKFLLHILNKKTNHLLIAIDPAQNLYGGKITWKEVGIQARGRVKTLKRTYRNTKQILEFAYMFNPNRVTRLSESDTDTPLFPELTQREGSKPLIQSFENPDALIDFIITKITVLSKLLSLGDIGIIFQSKIYIKYYDSLKAKLIEENIAFKEIINKDDKENFDFDSNEVKLIGIHNVKGYEFHTVFLIGVDFVKINSPEMVNLLYVGITRATDELMIPYLTTNGKMPYIKKILEFK